MKNSDWAKLRFYHQWTEKFAEGALNFNPRFPRRFISAAMLRWISRWMGILWRTFLSEIYKILLEDWGLLYLQPIEIYIQIGNHCVQNALFLCNHFIFLLITPSARNTLCEQIKDRTHNVPYLHYINQEAKHACAYIFCLNITV